MKCQKKKYPTYKSGKDVRCEKEAKFIDKHGRHLCEHHYNMFMKQESKRGGE